MSQQELKRVEVIALRRSGRIDQAEAARRLGLSVRQVRRLEAKVAARGAAGLRSTRRGRPSNRRLAAPVVAKVGALIRAHYLTLPRFHVHQKFGNFLMNGGRHGKEGIGSESAVHGGV